MGITSRDIVSSRTMLHSTMSVLLMPALVGLASSTCSVTSSDEKAEANDPANYQDTINLPKVAELFWSHGDEERNHAIQFIQYLRMRGAENNDFFGGVPIQPRERAYNWSGVDEALRMALKMEKDVSAKMKEMIDICSIAGQDDPHAADWLTGTWLEEQMQGQRHLAGLINTFNNFKRGHDELAEWMFDQEL